MADYKSGWTGAEIDAGIQAARNALPKSGGTMAGTLTLNGNPTADFHAATKKYVDAVAKGAVYIPGMNGKCAYNLLDNSWFVNPINQRGQTSYSGAVYTIDRWRLTNEYSSVTIDDDGVTFSASGGWCYPQQFIPANNAMIGKTYTAAVCLKDGTVYTFGNGVLTTLSPSGNTLIGTRVALDNGVQLAIYMRTDGRLMFQPHIPDGESLGLKWAALYEGDYTAETLPPYVYKGYAVELAECQRYFQRLNASKSAWRFYNAAIRSTSVVTLPAIPISPMRANSPAVSFASGETMRLLSAPGGNTVYGVNNTAITSVFEVDYSQGDSLITIQLNVTNTGSQGNMASAMIGTNGAGYIDLSLDL